MRKAVRTAGQHDIAEKWSIPVAERGFAQVPNYLLFLNQFLDEDHRLSPVELLLLIELVATWWKKDEFPFPSMSTLAVRCGVSERQIQRAVTKLEKINFLKRVKRRSSGIIASNAYDLSPLRTILEKVAAAYPNAFPRRVEFGISAEFFAAEEPRTIAAPKPQEVDFDDDLDLDDLDEDIEIAAPKKAPALPRAVSQRVVSKRIIRIPKK